MMISETHGGRRKAFEWQLDGEDLVIRNEEKRFHVFPLSEILTIIKWIEQHFGRGWFPLANNVERLHNGTERPGLGIAILTSQPHDVPHAQGASYLGVVLEEAGFLEWNGVRRGIQWRLLSVPLSTEELRAVLQNCRSKSETG